MEIAEAAKDNISPTMTKQLARSFSKLFKNDRHETSHVTYQRHQRCSLLPTLNAQTSHKKSSRIPSTEMWETQC